MSRVALLIGVVVLVLLLAPIASADNGTSQSGYGGEPAVQVTIVQSGQAQADQDDDLPMTGLDLGLIFLGGSVLVLVGVGMRRVARQRRDGSA